MYSQLLFLKKKIGKTVRTVSLMIQYIKIFKSERMLHLSVFCVISPIYTLPCYLKIRIMIKMV